MRHVLRGTESAELRAAEARVSLHHEPVPVRRDACADPRCAARSRPRLALRSSQSNSRSISCAAMDRAAVDSEREMRPRTRCVPYWERARSVLRAAWPPMRMSSRGAVGLDQRFRECLVLQGRCLLRDIPIPRELARPTARDQQCPLGFAVGLTPSRGSPPRLAKRKRCIHVPLRPQHTLDIGERERALPAEPGPHRLPHHA